MYSSVNHLNVTQGDPAWDKIVAQLREYTEGCVAEFLSFETTLFNLQTYEFSHAGVHEIQEGDCVPYHQDMEVTKRDDDIKLSHFAVLCYLNDDYEGGELVFPHQKKSVKPVKGSVLVFPTSFMFPHVVTPVFGNSRYMARLSYHHALFPDNLN